MRLLIRVLGVFAVMLAIYYVHYYIDLWSVKRASLTFITDAANDMASDWDARKFSRYADAAAGSSKELEPVFANARRLGKLKSAVTCTIDDFSHYKYPGTSVLYISATYECTGEFEKANATIQYTIYRFTDKISWKIRSFNLYSTYFSSGQAR